MNSFIHWVSPSTLHSLGWVLVHFLWQGAAVAALAGLLMSLCRLAQARYAIAVVALVAMVAAPVGTFILLEHSNRAVTGPCCFTPSVLSTPVHTVSSTTLSAIDRLSPSRDLAPWLVGTWLLGVALFSLRSAGGFLLLERERRRYSACVDDRLLAICKALQQRIGLERTIRYCQCQWMQAPAVVGWFRPVVLLPVTALTGLSEEQLRSIIAHELAHIQRFDAFVNAFQVAVETLLFYHPAVWWLNRRIRTEREHCCDDTAIALCGNAIEYARALTLMEEWRSAPVLVMAANRGPLSERVFRVLGLKSVHSRTRGMGWAGGVLCLAAALAAGNGLVSLAYPRLHAGAASIARSSVGYFGVVDFASQTNPVSQAPPARQAKPSTARPQSAPQSVSGGSYIEAMKAAGLENLTADQLIALKIQDVTPEYVRSVHDQGLHPDADQFVSMRIQGVTPEDVQQFRTLGLSPNIDQLISMRIQGVDATYVKELKNAGVQAGADQLVSMRIQGVTPAEVGEFHHLGVQPDADQLVSMRIQGVTPDYVRDIHALGMTPTVDQFVSMRIQGVTPDYIKGLQTAGFKFTVDDIISAKIQQITPEFIEKAVEHGFKDLTLDKLIQLKQLGILESRAEL